MTVKEFAEYLLNNFNEDNEIVLQRWMGDADEGVFDEPDLERLKEIDNMVVIL